MAWLGIVCGPGTVLTDVTCHEVGGLINKKQDEIFDYKTHFLAQQALAEVKCHFGQMSLQCQFTSCGVLGLTNPPP